MQFASFLGLAHFIEDYVDMRQFDAVSVSTARLEQMQNVVANTGR